MKYILGRAEDVDGEVTGNEARDRGGTDCGFKNFISAM